MAPITLSGAFGLVFVGYKKTIELYDWTLKHQSDVVGDKTALGSARSFVIVDKVWAESTPTALSLRLNHHWWVWEAPICEQDGRTFSFVTRTDPKVLLEGRNWYAPRQVRIPG